MLAYNSLAHCRPHSSNEKRVGSGRLIPERAEKPDRHDRGERNDLRSERGGKARRTFRMGAWERSMCIHG